MDNLQLIINNCKIGNRNLNIKQDNYQLSIINYQLKMGLMKLFSGDEILALALQQKIEAIGINTVIRNNNQANVLPSIQPQKAVELFIQETDFSKANPIVEEFRLSL